jgi:MinD-like ATPase involved in chromosome partitioning or flagellar assembly
MGLIVAIHSYRGGTGKSNTVANVAALLACRGLRVGVADTDIQSPGIHTLFGLREADIKRSLNDYLWGQCAVQDAAYDVTPTACRTADGRIFLLPASIRATDIVRILQDGYDVSLLDTGFSELSATLGLDYLLLDTHPGLSEEALLSIALSDRLVVLLRPDEQDYQGTSVTLKVAERLAVPALGLMVNKAPGSLLNDQLRASLEANYGHPVWAMAPHSDALMLMGSARLFALEEPNDAVTRAWQTLADRIQNP